jgi:hypothetical protein
MIKNPPDSSGPMRLQPNAHDPTAATPMLPAMPHTGLERKETKAESQQRAPVPELAKRPPTRAEAVRAALARIARRKSLRKQRAAQRG